jgi:hypothetical protein
MAAHLQQACLKNGKQSYRASTYDAYIGYYFIHLSIFFTTNVVEANILPEWQLA